MGFSPRLCVSAGMGFRYCVVEFLFHHIAGGRDQRRRSGSSLFCGDGPVFPAETPRRREVFVVSVFLCVSAELGVR